MNKEEQHIKPYVPKVPKIEKSISFSVSRRRKSPKRIGIQGDLGSMDVAISATNLTKRFGNFTAVDQITFEVKQGEIFGFLGANGAGKTTAMRMLCGLLKPTNGEAIVAGFDVFKEQEKIKKNIGYMSQKFSLMKI